MSCVCDCFFVCFFQFFGVWELWEASSQLLRMTLGAELLEPAEGADPIPKNAMVGFPLLLLLHQHLSSARVIAE